MHSYYGRILQRTILLYAVRPEYRQAIPTYNPYRAIPAYVYTLINVFDYLFFITPRCIKKIHDNQINASQKRCYYHVYILYTGYPVGIVSRPKVRVAEHNKCPTMSPSIYLPLISRRCHYIMI